MSSLSKKHFSEIFRIEIRRALRNNGSPEPIFKNDDERSYFLTIFKPRVFESFLATEDGNSSVTAKSEKLVVIEKGTKLD